SAKADIGIGYAPLNARRGRDRASPDEATLPVRDSSPAAPGAGRPSHSARRSPVSRKFPRLFSPLRIRSHILRNRIVFGAHTANMAVEGVPTERHIAYYAERAIGGAGMIVVEPMPVHA